MGRIGYGPGNDGCPVFNAHASPSHCIPPSNLETGLLHPKVEK